MRGRARSLFQVTELCRLCRICKGWRDIIFESQDLWGHIAFKPCERHVTGEILARLLSEPRTNSLRTLDVSNCIHLLPEHLEAVIQSCGQKIETLVLSNCPAVNDTVLSAVAATCREVSCMRAASPGKRGRAREACRTISCSMWTGSSVQR